MLAREIISKRELLIQQRLDDNRTFRPEDHRGAVREGTALVQGIVLCGLCGRRMSVRYAPDGVTPIHIKLRITSI